MTAPPNPAAVDRPIIFSAPMVRALLEGRKTQTRRVLKAKPGMKIADCTVDAGGGRLELPVEKLRVPYGVGDRLWVRESIVSTPGGIAYCADGGDHYGAGGKLRVRPSIHMPRWASRLTLTVTDVRVQRLQEISEEDARAEGATMRLECHGFRGRDPGWSMDWSRVGQPSRYARDTVALTESDISLGDPVTAFASFINQLHDPRWNMKGDGIFAANPWVVALTFTVERRNIDAQ